jgi:hypothetical protein
VEHTRDAVKNQNASESGLPLLCVFWAGNLTLDARMLEEGGCLLGM